MNRASWLGTVHGLLIVMVSGTVCKLAGSVAGQWQVQPRSLCVLSENPGPYPYLSNPNAADVNSGLSLLSNNVYTLSDEQLPTHWRHGMYQQLKFIEHAQQGQWGYLKNVLVQKVESFLIYRRYLELSMEYPTLPVPYREAALQKLAMINGCLETLHQDLALIRHYQTQWSGGS